jgi:hypothetical protein
MSHGLALREFDCSDFTAHCGAFAARAALVTAMSLMDASTHRYSKGRKA